MLDNVIGGGRYEEMKRLAEDRLDGELTSNLLTSRYGLNE